MNKERFIEQQMALGHSLHLHDGVWWQQQSPFHCRPAIRLEAIAPGAARPARIRSLAGYGHVVPAGAPGNSVISVMMMRREKGAPFGVEDLPSRRRSQVRRGLKKTEVKRIEDLKPLMEDVRQIVISTRMRTGVGLPVSHYTDHFDEWSQSILKLFALEDRPWWGAFVEGRLIAYFQTTLLDDMLTIGAAKSHTDFLAHCPNDALLFAVMDEAFNRMGCRVIEYGDWTPADERLQFFKQSYGFAKCDFPEHIHLNPLARPVLRLRRTLLRRRRAAAADVRPANEEGKE